VDEVCDRCGAPLDRLPACPHCLLTADIGPHVVGDRYVLEAEIGRGGMGTVYRALDPHDGSTVAVKLLHGVLLEEPEVLERFRREARVLALLRHPGIVRFKDWGIEDAAAYIVMEHVDGRSLAGELPLPRTRVADTARQLCAALAHAHRRGLVHRDLKPENILVDAQGTVKVSDFGIATFAADPHTAPSRLTRAHHVVGTPAYMAPEALRGAPADARMDVYSLGVLLYEMVEGHPPQGYFEPPHPFQEILKKALHADPAQRYADAEAMLRDLEPAAPPPGHRSLPMLDTLAAMVSAIVLGGAAAMSLRKLSGRVAGHAAAFVPGQAVTDGLGAAIAVLGLGLVLVALLLQRWRRLGYGSATPGPITQTSAALRFALSSVVLAAWQGAIGFPVGAGPALALILYATQAAGLAAAAWGFLECRRRRVSEDEPFLLVAVAGLVSSTLVEMLPRPLWS